MPSGVGYGEGCPLFSQLGGLGSVVSSLSGVRGRAPAENGFWRILKATERSFLYLYDKICGGQFALSSPTPNSGGTCPSVPPVIYAHVYSNKNDSTNCRHEMIGYKRLKQVSLDATRRYASAGRTLVAAPQPKKCIWLRYDLDL